MSGLLSDPQLVDSQLLFFGGGAEELVPVRHFERILCNLDNQTRQALHPLKNELESAVVPAL